MTVFVIRDGRLAEKVTLGRPTRSDLCSPMVSRMTPFDSPVTGKEITSWREREADMRAVDAVDPRDLPHGSEMRRGRAAQAKEQSDA